MYLARLGRRGPLFRHQCLEPSYTAAVNVPALLRSDLTHAASAGRVVSEDADCIVGSDGNGERRRSVTSSAVHLLRSLVRGKMYEATSLPRAPNERSVSLRCVVCHVQVNALSPCAAL